MKTTLIAAAALLALGTLPALAESEGGHDPFALATPGITTTFGTAAADTGSNAYPDMTGRPGSAIAVYAGTLEPDTGTEQPVQTANSLPVGADVNGRAYAHLGTPDQGLAVRTASRGTLAY